MAEQTQTQMKPTGILPDNRLVSYFKAGYPVLYMVTAEEARAEATIAVSTFLPVSSKKNLVCWSATQGIWSPYQEDGLTNVKMTDPVQTLQWIKQTKLVSTVYILRDLHPYFTGTAGILVIRLLRDLCRDLQQLQSTLLIMSPVARLPIELQREVVQIDYDLPDRVEIAGVFDRLYGGAKERLLTMGLGVDDDERERIVGAAMGLTSVEATNAFSMAMVDAAQKRGKIADLVLKEKALAVKKTGILEYYETKEDISAVGGLENLKLWLRRRSQAFTKKAREFGLPPAKGVLLVGVPGGGKSLVAKVASSIFEVPLIRFDIARVFAGLVGQSEEQMRTALQTIDAIGPSIVWVDEMEKAFAGASGSGSNDSGVTRRVFGTFLTWMQEKTSPSFIVATANSIIGIPPEMLRKGRFDDNFYIGLPGQIARAEIFKIQLKKYKRGHLDLDIKAMVEKSKKMTGAEIEGAIIEGLFTAFEHNHELTTADVLAALGNTNPIAVSQKDELEAMTSWAKENAVNASKPDVESGDTVNEVGRQLAL